MFIRQHQQIPFSLLEKLALWGLRYANICVLLKPFTMKLFHSMAKVRYRGTVSVTPELVFYPAIFGLS